MKYPRLFSVFRRNDHNKVSGTGKVIDGVVFESGICVISWTTKLSSLGVYDTFDHFKAIHIDAHPGNKSQVVWRDENENFKRSYR